MKNIGVFYKNLYTFLDREVHKLLDQNRMVAVEMPDSKKMYYCVIETFHDGVLGIMLFEDIFRDDLFNNFDGRGYPVMYYKAKGFMSQELREEHL